MCLSVISNGKRKVYGCNFDISMMESRVSIHGSGVFIEAFDKTVGWIPLFGAGQKRIFVTMPTCWPYDKRSDYREGDVNIVNISVDLLLGKRTFEDVRYLVSNDMICSIPSITFQGHCADREGNVLRYTPHVGWEYLEKPLFSVMSNFSPFKDAEGMGRNRFERAEEIFYACNDFDVDECFHLLSECSMTAPPTKASLVFTPEDGTVYWCEDREWNKIKSAIIK